MIESLIMLVVYLIVIGMIAWLLYWVVDQLPLPPPFHTVVRILIAAVCVILIAYLLLGLVGQTPRLGRL